MKTFQFKIQLLGVSNPIVWRRILVSDNITFDEFHDLIQIAFGWENQHLYLFSEKGWKSKTLYQIPDEDDFDDDDHEIVDSTKTLIKKVINKSSQTLIYIYDFGDGWKHSITLEKIIDGIQFPSCIDGKGACPPEDCGGDIGYKNLLTILKDPDHEEYSEMKNWLGLTETENIDVNVFDIDQTSKNLRQYYGG